MLRKITSLFALVLISYGVSAQKLHERKHKELMSLSGHYNLSGWHFAPGLTYMLPKKHNEADVENVIDPKGKLAVYAEVGRYKVFKHGTIFNYMDYSLAFKRLSGKEEYYGNEGVFKQNFLLANFNINNIIQLTDYTFIQNSLGVNVDYMLFGKIEESGSGMADPIKLLGQFHYKFGYGIKVAENLFIIPSVETPILSAYKWDKGKSTLEYFSSRYRPLIFSVRFAFLGKPKAGACRVPDSDPFSDKKNGDGLMK
jgi:hypothetical protein